MLAESDRALAVVRDLFGDDPKVSSNHACIKNYDPVP